MSLTMASMQRWLMRGCATAAITLAGCSSLPVITPDMARVDPSSVQLQAANGHILSPERSREIIAKAGNGSGSDVLSRHLALEQAVSDSPLVVGNRVTLLQDGPNTYATMFRLIAAARDSINMETYILEEDDVGRRLADALIAKQRSGVQVNLIHDGVGTLKTSKEFFQRLSDAGVAVVAFNPVNPLAAKAGWQVNQRDHRKLLVVDGRSAVLGGINISSVYSSSPGAGSTGGSTIGSGADKKEALPWRDTDLLVEGPVVAELQKLFFETWTAQKGPTPAPRRYFPALQPRGTEVVRALNSSPDDPFSQIYVTLISAINSAENEILLTNAYFVPDPQLMQALIDAVKRGVDVKLIVPSKTDSSLVFHAGRAHYEKLLEGGVKLYERRDALLHAKTVVIDGVWSTVGSTNLDWRSFLHNQELTAVILGTDFGSKMRDAFARDLAASDQVTLEAWRNRPVTTRYEGDVSLDSGSTGYEHPSALPARSRRRPSRSPLALGLAGGRRAGCGDAEGTVRVAPGQVREQPVRSAARSRIDAELGRPEGRRLRVVEHPFSTVQQALVSPEHWCDILILHLNVKRCKASAGGRRRRSASTSAASSTSRSRMRTSSTQVSRRCVERRLPAGAPERRRRPAQHEELPYPGRGGADRGEAHRHSHVVRVRLRIRGEDGDADLSRHARQRQGRLHDRRQEADGKPVYQAGVLGLLERNTMRYYLAIDAYLSAYGLPAAEQPEKRIREWYASTERYAQQLHEMDEAEYLDMKRKEMRRQQES
jgi:cardiolipin synthase